MSGDDRRPFRKRNYPGKAYALNARIVDENVDRIGLRVDRLERFSDAARISDIGFEVDNADSRLGGRQLIEGEHAGAVSEQPLGDCIAYAARGAGDDGDAASKGIGSGSASAQYINQPPLTLIVAPVT
jgi:hypothetical protein